MAGQRRAVAEVLIVAAVAALLQVESPAAADDSSCLQFLSCGARGVGLATGDGFQVGLFVAGADGSAQEVSGGNASCPDCEWEIVPSCEGNTPGTGSNDLNCHQASMACRSTGGTLVDVYLKKPGEPWRSVSSFCADPSRPVTTPAQIAGLAAERFADMTLPVPGLQSQPPGGTAVNLPTVFYSDDLAPITIGVTLRGFSASLTATPTSWHWDFGDGTTMTTADPGAAYPHQTITHAYAARGPVTASVTTTWTGSVVVPEMGELPIAETVTRTSTRVIPVREARTELTLDAS